VANIAVSAHAAVKACQAGNTDNPQSRESRIVAVAGGLRIVSMGATLRVDPNRLREAARAQSAVGTFVSGMRTGQSMASAGASMPGLLSEEACRFAGSMFDTAASAVQDELTAHSTNLSAAADRYHRTDEEFGRRLRKVAQ
jgi:Excreted virulence factor EspC, type VII ESX diderm